MIRSVEECEKIALLYAKYYPPAIKQEIEGYIQSQKLAERVNVMAFLQPKTYDLKEDYLAEIFRECKIPRQIREEIINLPGFGSSRTYWLLNHMYGLQGWPHLATRILLRPEDVLERTTSIVLDGSPSDFKKKLNPKLIQILRAWIDEWYPKDDPLNIKIVT